MVQVPNWRAAFVSALLTAPALAQEPVKLLPGPFEIPRRIGPLEFDGKPHDFGDAASGIGYGYNGAGAMLNIYIYTAGRKDIPDGANTVPSCELTEGAKYDISSAKGYRKVKLRHDQLARLAPPADAPLAREAVFDLEIDRAKVVSYVWLTSAAGYFVKLRFTMSAELGDELQSARRAVLDALGAALAPHLEPVDPEAKQRVSMVVAGDVPEISHSFVYLAVLNSITNKNPGRVPVCGGDFQPTFAEEIQALESAIKSVKEGHESPDNIRLIAVAAGLGYLDEFTWTHRHRAYWGKKPPAGLDLRGFKRWQKQHLKGFQELRLGRLRVEYPRELPLEPLP